MCTYIIIHDTLEDIPFTGISNRLKEKAHLTECSNNCIISLMLGK